MDDSDAMFETAAWRRAGAATHEAPASTSRREREQRVRRGTRRFLIDFEPLDVVGVPQTIARETAPASGWEPKAAATPAE